MAITNLPDVKFLENENGFIAPATTSDAVAITKEIPGVYSLTDSLNNHINLCKDIDQYGVMKKYSLETAIEKLREIFGNSLQSVAGTKVTFKTLDGFVQEWICEDDGREFRSRSNSWRMVDTTAAGTKTGNLEIQADREVYVLRGGGSSSLMRKLNFIRPKLRFLLNGKYIVSNDATGSLGDEETHQNESVVGDKSYTEGNYLTVRLMDGLSSNPIYVPEDGGVPTTSDATTPGKQYGILSREGEYLTQQANETFNVESIYRITEEDLFQEFPDTYKDIFRTSERVFKGNRQLINLRADYKGVVGFTTIYVVRVPNSFRTSSGGGIQDMTVTTEDNDNYLHVKTKFKGIGICPELSIPACIYYNTTFTTDKVKSYGVTVTDDKGVDYTDMFEFAAPLGSTASDSIATAYRCKDIINLDNFMTLNFKMRLNTGEKIQN